MKLANAIVVLALVQLHLPVLQCSAYAPPRGCEFSEEGAGIQGGVNYRGCQTQTTSSRTCQKWTEQTPHRHTYTPSKHPDGGLGDHNFCRNPDVTLSDWDWDWDDYDHGTPDIWCYTTDPAKRWELCSPIKSITNPALTPTSTPPPPPPSSSSALRLQVNMTLSNVHIDDLSYPHEANIFQDVAEIFFQTLELSDVAHIFFQTLELSQGPSGSINVSVTINDDTIDSHSLQAKVDTKRGILESLVVRSVSSIPDLPTAGPIQVVSFLRGIVESETYSPTSIRTAATASPLFVTSAPASTSFSAPSTHSTRQDRNSLDFVTDMYFGMILLAVIVVICRVWWTCRKSMRRRGGASWSSGSRSSRSKL